MLRQNWVLLGLTGAMLLTGCQQLPLRQRAGDTTQRAGDTTQRAGASKGDRDKLGSQLSLARLSERHGQDDYAAQVYEVILRDHPTNVAANHRLAVIASRKQDFDKAERHFQQALEHGTRDPELLADIGYYFYLREQMDDAEQMLRESLVANPQNKSARNNLALVLGEQGRLVEAMDEFKKVVSEAEAHANMGYVFTMLGDVQQATIEYNRALSLDPTLRSAAEALIQLQDRIKSDHAIALNRPPADQPIAVAVAVAADKAVAPPSPEASLASAEPTASPVPNRTARTEMVDLRQNDWGQSFHASPDASNAPRTESKLTASKFDRPRRPMDERASQSNSTASLRKHSLVAPASYEPPTQQPAPSSKAESHFQLSDEDSEQGDAEQGDAEHRMNRPMETDPQTSPSGTNDSTRRGKRLALPWRLPNWSSQR